MLVSHKKHFIFTKTFKTAGTSVESYFEQYCMPDGEWQESHPREEFISETGIIGYRGIKKDNLTWYNHMPAKRISDLIGHDIFESYFKFTVIRNPFDKLISAFFWDYKHFFLDNRQIAKCTIIDNFRRWIQNGGIHIDRDKYLIDEQECVDYFIHFEDLHNGIKHVCNHLSIPFEASRIPEFKKGIRHHRINIQDYYDNKTKQIVKEKYAWELERFGYNLPI